MIGERMNKTVVFMLLIVVLSFALSFYFYPQMPERMATHWNVKGEPDGYMPKLWGVLIMPVISLGLIGLFLVLPKIDPLKRNYPAFKKYYNIIVLLVLGFLFYIHAISIVLNLSFNLNITYLIMPAMGIIFLIIGYILPHCKRNWFIGIRTPWTLSSDRVWKETHKIGGKLFVIYAIFIFLALFAYEFVIEYFFWLVIGPLMTLAVSLFIYSYIEYTKEEVRK